MASSLLLSLLFLLPLVSSSSSLQHLLLPLTHTLSTTTPALLQHILKSSSLHSSTRHRRHRPYPQQLSLPLSPGSDYTLTLSLSPHSSAVVFLDTGSDLLWLPCSPFQCILCESKPQPPSPPLPLLSSSSPVPCSSPLCSAAHSSLPSADLCAISSCPLDAIETSSCSSTPCPTFYYAYGDGSLVASLRRATASISSLHFPNLTFGCAHSALAEPIGVAGFGRGPLSLPAQLSSVHPNLADGFSYCLVSHSFRPEKLLRPSPLILGRRASSPKMPFLFTPMLHNPKHPYFYSVALEAVSIGSARIESPASLIGIDSRGNGGMVVDSGTTFTMIPASMYSRITREFRRKMAAAGFAHSSAAEKETGLGPCYYYKGRKEKMKVPEMQLHFAGNASVRLPTRNYFLGFGMNGEEVGCLMVMDGGDEAEGGPAGTLGNFQQQGMEVVYDLAGRRVGFARRRCAKLWESLARGGR